MLLTTIMIISPDDMFLVLYNRQLLIKYKTYLSFILIGFCLNHFKWFIVVLSIN